MGYLKPVQNEGTKALRKLLTEAIKKLDLISAENETYVVAECPDKFNDSGQDDYWFAVQVGDSIWVQSHFYKEFSPAKTVERQNYYYDNNDNVAPECSEVNNTVILEARSVLSKLITEDWRKLTSSALPDTYCNGDLIALMRFRDQHWLCLGKPNVHEITVWMWNEDSQFTCFAECDDRLDQTIGQRMPLTFFDINVAALETLQKGALKEFVPTICDASSSEELEKIVNAAVQKIVGLTNDAIRLSWSNWRSFVYENDLIYEPRNPGIPGPDPTRKTRKDIIYPDHIYSICEVFDRKALRLFNEAYGRTYGWGGNLNLHVEAGSAFLWQDLSVFQLLNGRLKFVGLLDSNNSYDLPDFMKSYKPQY